MMCRRGNRGFALISTYFTIALFLIYSNSLTLRTVTERVASERLRERLQALDLAQAAAEQLREELYSFLTSDVYLAITPGTGNAVEALQWFDDLGAAIADSGIDPPTPLFILTDRNGDSLITWDDYNSGSLGLDGTKANPLRVTGLPTVDASQPAALQPRAWIVSIKKHQIPDPNNPSQSVDDPDPLAPRVLTLEAEARVGSTTKHIRTTYEVKLGMSEIYRYAYFMNNYGYLKNSGGSYEAGIIGEARSNGDFTFAGRTHMAGDIYASENPALGAAGTISGDPWNYSTWNYWDWHPERGRPARLPALHGRPPVGGTAKILPYGQGFDNATTTMNGDRVEQKRYERQPVQPMPYMGDLIFYKSLALQRGGSLTYNDPGPDGKYGYWGAPGDDAPNPVPIAGVYKGPDGVAGVNPDTGINDDNTPLVLVGHQDKPIVINGPVVVPGDVIIRGVITGRGTIYAGRNIHAVGGVVYKDPPKWPTLERNRVTGQLSTRCKTSADITNLGTLCNNGNYYPSGVTPPAGCME